MPRCGVAGSYKDLDRPAAGHFRTARRLFLSQPGYAQQL